MSEDELKAAIAARPMAELKRLRSWLDECISDAWDRQIEADEKAGRLDAWIREVDAEIAAGRTLPLFRDE